jgi:hypothetical protein
MYWLHRNHRPGELLATLCSIDKCSIARAIGPSITYRIAGRQLVGNWSGNWPARPSRLGSKTGGHLISETPVTSFNQIQYRVHWCYDGISRVGHYQEPLRYLHRRHLVDIQTRLWLDKKRSTTRHGRARHGRARHGWAGRGKARFSRFSKIGKGDSVKRAAFFIE